MKPDNFKMEQFWADPDQGIATMMVSYTPTVLTTGKTGTFTKCLHHFEFKHGKIHKFKNFWSNVAELDALFKLSGEDLEKRYRNVIDAWMQGKLFGPGCKAEAEKWYTTDAVIDFTAPGLTNTDGFKMYYGTEGL